ncbi:tRNA 5-methoxyuridine(34)/uridine 5-oxyacetic acid(34) synthase CmoB [Alginatibacterium sediminis]|uniref:tRNA U34 carboxymethyltransferase n=1 Tax=Alginatibacterium sediminis TaxID=2164068 RepID=A0A420EFX4_9ALTE|nr:tRNA 5-methoxyuridine(34)/uridine 5-oxyacetic acid(34) synthase CmoB [Alginatibacterium sediminis]RKF19609.1 tRNA 5-methoxyuridine(34)/uridine 5-oxyacetic acid(34) synthase CmoB [Alginatibacterium sediminis]
MIDFSNFYQLIAQNRLQHWLRCLPEQLHQWQANNTHGDFPHWQRVVDKLPSVNSKFVELKNAVSIGKVGELDPSEIRKTESLLKQLSPWRKGPFDIHGVHIDTEWRSDWKWQRLLPHISSLENRFVLDVGCGSGYHMWRMLGEKAQFVVGIDPSSLFLAQFEAVRKFANNDQRVHLLPLGIEQLPKLRAFDTVFSMGVLYHRRSPIDHLYQLKAQLRTGGELILETLVVDGDVNDVLVPPDRYGKMRNVWFIPSAPALVSWLLKVGFIDVHIVDMDQTSIDEQRATDWMNFESLPDFLDPLDPSKTIEGHPAPLRTIIVAKNPD